jgi:hypothetical protein
MSQETILENLVKEFKSIIAEQGITFITIDTTNYDASRNFEAVTTAAFELGCYITFDNHDKYTNVIVNKLYPEYDFEQYNHFWENHLVAIFGESAIKPVSILPISNEAVKFVY